MNVENIVSMTIWGVALIASFVILFKLIALWRYTSAETFVADVFITISGFIMGGLLMLISFISFEDALSFFTLSNYVGENAKGKPYVVLCAKNHSDSALSFENGHDIYDLYNGEDLHLSKKGGLYDKKGNLLDRDSCRPYERISKNPEKFICLADKFEIKDKYAGHIPNGYNGAFNGIPLRKLHGAFIDDMTKILGFDGMKFYYNQKMFRGGVMRDYEQSKVFADNLPLNPNFVSGYCKVKKEVKLHKAACQGKDGKAEGKFYALGKHIVLAKLKKVKPQDYYVDDKKVKGVGTVLIEKHYDKALCKVKN